MRNPIDALAFGLTGKERLQDSTTEELRRIAERYPYFAPAQFLLLHKLHQEGLTEEAEAQHRKAVLYYPDPLSFEAFVSSGRFFAGEKEVEEENHFPFHKNLSPAEPQAFVNEEALSTTDEIVDEPKEFDEEPQAFADAELVTVPIEADPEKEEALQDEKPEGQDGDEQNTASDNAFFAPANEEKENTTADKDATSFHAQEKLAEALAFEPYHTVDYFASQGIKMSTDEIPKDKLGKQLKSFTEWLKTMKRLPAAQLATSPESTAEKGVETLADRSVSESKVVTEAMAEVWVKQGNAEKAEAIYAELSLRNPSKKAYFAAKIEQLKQS